MESLEFPDVRQLTVPMVTFLYVLLKCMLYVCTAEKSCLDVDNDDGGLR